MTNLSAADRRTVLRLVVWVFGLYALTMAGRVVSGDGETMFQTTRAVVERGQLSIDQRRKQRLAVAGATSANMVWGSQSSRHRLSWPDA